MSSYAPIGIFCVLSGIFVILAVLFRWKIFMNFSRVQGWYKLLGDKLATVLYIVDGIILIGIGLLLMSGYMD